MGETLQLRLLGTPQIRIDDVPLAGSIPGKALAILYYLAVTGRPQTRSALAGLLWGDMPEGAARSNLRKALASLRHSLGVFLDIDRYTIAFKPEAGYWLDVTEFVARAGDLSVTTDRERLQEAVDLYRGDFLEGFYVLHAPDFELWVLAERTRLHELVVQALYSLAARHAEQGALGQAIGYTRRLLNLEPWREEAHRQLMLLLARGGQRGAALAQYETCRRVLAEELGVEPGTETLALAKAIEQDRIWLDAPEVGTGAATEMRPITKPTPRPRFPTSLVGRAAEMETLRRVWGRVFAGEGQVVLVEGEPGIGKTRLIEELLAEVAENAAVLRAKCPDLQDPLAYTLFVDPLRQALSGGRPPGLTDTWLAEVGRLLPELYDRYPDLPQPAQLEPGAERRRLFDAVCTTLLVLANGQPLVLFTDDLQWADVTSLELLCHLSGWIGEAPVLILGAYRPHEVGVEHPLHRPRQDWQRTGLLAGLSLDTLSETAVAQLLQELTTWTGQDPTFGELIHRETAGNPLFVVETVASLRDEGRLPERAEDWSDDFLAEIPVIPSQVQTVIETRLHCLDELSRGLIAAASVLRSSFEAEMVQAVSGRSELETLGRLERLLGVGLLIQAGEDRFDFSHDKIREVAHGGLSQLRRKLLHRRVAATLEHGHQGQEDTVAERLAYHYGQAGVPEKALAYYIQAGHAARTQFAFQTAIGHYQNALARQKEQRDYEGAARTLMQLGLTYHTDFDFRQARQAYEEGFALWQRAGKMQPANLAPAPHALRLAREDPMSLDPTVAGLWSIHDQLFSGLVEESPEMEPVPDVARSWEVLDGGRKYVFHLRDDVRWSDGARVTAGDFEYAWKRALDPVTGAHLTGLYDVKGARAFHQGEVFDPDQVGVKALDEVTLVVELEEPTSYFLNLLTKTLAFPAPRHVVAAYGQAWAAPHHVVTNGPFRIESWDRGDSAVLVRNPAYHGRFAGNVERVELRLLPYDPLTNLALYEAHAPDVVMDTLPPPEMDRIRQQRAGEYVSAPWRQVSFIGFDLSRPPFDDSRVRRAFALVIDRERLADVVLGGAAFPATGGLVPLGMPGHSAGIAPPYDPAQARQLLAEAGYPEGRSFPAMHWLLPQGREPMAEYLQTQWHKHLGVVLPIGEVVGWPRFGESLRRESPPLYIAGDVGNYPDPDSFLRGTLADYEIQWQNEAFARLVEKARRVTDQEDRLKLYRQADRLLVAEAPIIPLTYGRGHLLVKPWVRKYPISASKWWFWKDVIIEPH